MKPKKANKSVGLEKSHRVKFNPKTNRWECNCGWSDSTNLPSTELSEALKHLTE